MNINLFPNIERTINLTSENGQKIKGNLRELPRPENRGAFDHQTVISTNGAKHEL